MAIVYETGARISEILTLRIRDIEDCGEYILENQNQDKE